MESSNLLIICALAFGAVFVLLMFLALVMRIIIAVFPQVKETFDSTLLAAIASSTSAAYPGTIITKVEEIK
jgi:Na+-transporting methylmalonyl-CoA/oxaloacetate decarboxylase gamma subunit